MLILLVLTVSLLSDSSSAVSSQLFKNPDFESSSFGGNWECNACTLTSSNDKYNGHHSAQITHRTHEYSSVRQTVSVTGGHTYIMIGYVKLLNMSPGHMYHQLKVTARYSQNGHNHYISVSRMNMLQKDFGWVEIGGDFFIPSGTNSVAIYIQIPETDVNYLVDHMSLYQLQKDNNLMTEAKHRIQSLRMAALTVRVNNSASLDTSNLEIDVKQLKHTFAFGSAVGAAMIVDPAHQKYQDFFYDNFEWAVTENALKWRIMEWTRTHIRYDTPLKAIDAMRARGITVRGHNMFWDFDSHSPSWLSTLSRDQLLDAMHVRVNGTIAHTKGKLVHWDVNNENLHGDYFERRLHNPNITSSMFKWIHQLEPGVKLFLNDYNIVNSNTYTTAYKMQAKILKASNVPVYGIGVQSHFKSSNIDYDAVKYRLDKVAEAGLPIWITEMSILDTDNQKKADALEKLLTLYFSHPAVEGVLFWGFWDGKVFDRRIALANGPDVVPNAAGLRYQTLFKQTWRTNITRPLHHGVHISGYHGHYSLDVKHNGKLIESQVFTLGRHGKLVTVNLHGSDTHVTSTSVFG